MSPSILISRRELRLAIVRLLELERLLPISHKARSPGSDDEKELVFVYTSSMPTFEENRDQV